MASEIKWIKITTDMFEDEKIDFITSLPESDAILVIWIRLLTLAGKCNAGGYVFLTEKIPYTDEMLAHKFKKPLNIVKLALETFNRLDMVIMDERGIYFPKWQRYQNVEGMERQRMLTNERVKKHRQKQAELPSSNVNETLHNVTVTHLEVEEDKELDIEKEKDISTTTSEAYSEEIVDVYRKVFGGIVLKGLIAEYIAKLLNRGCTSLFIKELLYEVGESSTNPNLKLMQSIGERWIKDGIETREQSKRQRDQNNTKVSHISRVKNQKPVLPITQNPTGPAKELSPEEQEQMQRLINKLGKPQAEAN